MCSVYVHVIPCHRGSACWCSSPVAAVVSQRAGQSLDELTHTAPGERKTKKERARRRGRRKRHDEAERGKKVFGCKWRRGTERDKRGKTKKKEFQEINIKAKTLSMFRRKNIHLQGYEMQPLCKQWKALH